MEEPHPPKGFRKAIPVTVKLDAVIRQNGRCTTCGERLGELKGTEFDHVPALQLRGWNSLEEDTIPPANSPDHIEAKHKDCHQAKTTGRAGTSNKGDRRSGDTTSIAKLRRLTRKQQEFQQRMLSKGSEESTEEQAKPKSKWPKRPFPSSRRKVGEKHQDGQG